MVFSWLLYSNYPPCPMGCPSAHWTSSGFEFLSYLLAFVVCFCCCRTCIAVVGVVLRNLIRLGLWQVYWCGDGLLRALFFRIFSLLLMNLMLLIFVNLVLRLLFFFHISWLSLRLNVEKHCFFIVFVVLFRMN